jgi:hypothetical protein
MEHEKPVLVTLAENECNIPSARQYPLFSVEIPMFLTGTVSLLIKSLKIPKWRNKKPQIEGQNKGQTDKQ